MARTLSTTPAAPAAAAAQLTAAEALVPSAVTSALVVAGVALRSAQAATTPLVTLAFFALLPALLALALVQEERLLVPCKRVFMAVFRCGDPLAEDAAPSAAARAVAAARAELHRALADRWPARRGLASASGSSPALALAVQPAQSRGARMRRRAAASSSNSSTSEIGGASGKSLYDQVKENLEDHAFRKAADAPIYFMDATTGLFLRVNAHNKLVFTNAPDASCLFHVTRGKTHHWGFLSAIYQRYVGQNFVGRVVVNSKKLQGWESFRVLQRPDSVEGGENAAGSGGGDAECSKTVYMILCSSRFGKGMWLAKNRRTSAPLSASLGPSRTASNTTSASGSAVGNTGDEHARDNIYLSKNFANALALTYATDLSAFEYLANDSYMGGGGRVATAPKAASPLPVAMGTTFKPPVLAVSERTHVALPWIADPSSKRFFELSDKQLTEVLSTTITRCTAREFIEMLFSEEARKFASEKIAAVVSAGAAGSKQLSEWHLHPTFGFVRKLSYRPEATTSDSDESRRISGEGGAAGPSPGLKAIAIDQYHSFVMNEKTMDKVTFRSKLYTLSTPYSNCFSIETVFELQDLVDTTTGGPSPVNVPVMQFRCYTGVHFTRSTMFASLVEKGALQGVKTTCDLLLETAKDRRGRVAVPAAPLSTGAAPSSATAAKTDGGVGTSPAPSVIPPHTLAMEVIKGMINAYHGAKSLHSRVSSLPARLPWKVNSALRQESLSARTADAPAAVAAPTKIPFFESTPQHFKLVLEEGLGGKVTPPLFFDSLLSDECSFLHVVHRQSGNMEVDVCAWRPYDSVLGGDSDSGGDASVRLQAFRMPLDGIPAVEIADVKDFQYYAFVHDERTGKKRLEFGSKLFVRDLPEGEHYSVRRCVLPLCGRTRSRRSCAAGYVGCRSRRSCTSR